MGTPASVLTVYQNGPIHVASDYSAFPNKYGWNELADYIWIDQPVYVFLLLLASGTHRQFVSGTGFSTVDENGFGGS